MYPRQLPTVVHLQNVKKPKIGFLSQSKHIVDLTIKSHDFSGIVDKCGEMQPVMLRELFPCSFG